MEIVYFISSLLANFSFVGIFAARLKEKVEIERKIGVFFQLLTIPMGYMGYFFVVNDYPVWIIVYLVIYILYSLYELLLDYVLKIEFRHQKKYVVPYIVLFTLSCWGMVAINFVFNLYYGLVIVVLYSLHTLLMIKSHKEADE